MAVARESGGGTKKKKRTWPKPPVSKAKKLNVKSKGKRG